MFRTFEETKSDLDPVTHIKPPAPIYYWPFQGGTSVAVPQCYMLLCPCVYYFQEYGITAANYASCFVLFCNLK